MHIQLTGPYILAASTGTQLHLKYNKIQQTKQILAKNGIESSAGESESESKSECHGDGNEIMECSKYSNSM